MNSILPFIFEKVLHLNEGSAFMLEFVFLVSVAKGDNCLPAEGVFPNTFAMAALRGFQITSSTKRAL